VGVVAGSNGDHRWPTTGGTSTVDDATSDTPCGIVTGFLDKAPVDGEAGAGVRRLGGA
jgi:hypothetical protein